ncbi:MAG: molybdopterin-dependent oxidoreductase [Alphaproteobacteria bacterium]|nr:molybdopterin-dependent oxidoreductase [Alphaproteobacteria bacterium]
MTSSLEKQPNVDQWLSVGTDGRVTVRSGKVDIGQRISTAMALIAAEELDVALERIDMAQVETGISPDEGVTSGSNSMQDSGQAVRLATATARRHMIARAAEALEVEPSTLEITDGLIRSRDSNLSVSYWELQGDQPFDIPIDPEIEIKAPETYTQVGEQVIARGMTELATGQSHFVHDMTMPGMLHARVVRPPHYHARLKNLDEALCRRLEDAAIRVVRDGSYLAVAGEDEYAVIKAAERLAAAAEWNMGNGLPTRDIYESLTANERVSLPVSNGVPQREPVPDLPEPPAGAAQTLRARYEKPYHMHGSLGPSAALSVAEGKEVHIWTHSQGVYVLREALAGGLGMDEDDLHIIHAPGAGCYGHNGADDAAVDAALIARALPSTPVLLKWTREDEHAWEPYSTAMAMELQASLDSDGNVVAWSHEAYGDTFMMRPRNAPPGEGAKRLLPLRYVANGADDPVPQPAMRYHVGVHRNLDPLYNFPNPRLVKNLVRGLPLRTSALRTLGGFANVFAIECFLDELAEAAGKDPVEFRLQHLDDERACAVVKAAADRLNANDTPANIGRGIAFSQYTNSKAYAAVGVELEVLDDATIKLHRAVIAVDAGQVVDPDGLTMQCEGGFIQAASWTLHEAVTFDRDGVTSRDWDSYPILRFGNIPEIETVLMDRPGDPFLGAGEAVSGPAGAAIAIALKEATGLRLRRMPFTPDAIRAAALNAPAGISS